MNRLRSAFLARSSIFFSTKAPSIVSVSAAAVGGGAPYVVEHPLHHGPGAVRPDILHAGIHRNRIIGNGVDRVGREVQRHALGPISAIYLLISDASVSVRIGGNPRASAP